jgi:hypothetical protein
LLETKALILEGRTAGYRTVGLSDPESITPPSVHRCTPMRADSCQHVAEDGIDLGRLFEGCVVTGILNDMKFVERRRSGLYCF